MDFIKPVYIEVFYSTPETNVKDDIGEKYPLSDCITRPMLFYDITSIGYHVDVNDSNRKYTEIYSGAYKFISHLNPKKVEALIATVLKTT